MFATLEDEPESHEGALKEGERLVVNVEYHFLMLGIPQLPSRSVMKLEKLPESLPPISAL